MTLTDCRCRSRGRGGHTVRCRINGGDARLFALTRTHFPAFARGVARPHAYRRLLVASVLRTEDLTPLEVATDEIRKKTRDLRAILAADNTDMKMLQMQLQGSVSLQVRLPELVASVG
jgi:hypothetical protein